MRLTQRHARGARDECGQSLPGPESARPSAHLPIDRAADGSVELSIGRSVMTGSVCARRHTRRRRAAPSAIGSGLGRPAAPGLSHCTGGGPRGDGQAAALPPWTPGSTPNATPGTACAPISPPLPAMPALASPN
jgi:hypothetical protein